MQKGGLPVQPSPEAWAQLAPWSLAVFIPCWLFGTFLRLYRWLHLLRPICPQLSERRAFGVSLLGFAALFAPMRMGGAGAADPDRARSPGRPDTSGRHGGRRTHRRRGDADVDPRCRSAHDYACAAAAVSQRLGRSRRARRAGVCVRDAGVLLERVRGAGAVLLLALARRTRVCSRWSAWCRSRSRTSSPAKSSASPTASDSCSRASTASRSCAIPSATGRSARSGFWCCYVASACPRRCLRRAS